MKKILVLLFMLISTNIIAQDKKPPATISIKGSATLKVQPDEGTVSITATYIGLDVNQTMLGLDRKAKELIKQFVAAGISEKSIKTTDFQVNKNMVYRRGLTKDSGFVATQNMQARFLYSKEKITQILNKFSESPQDFNLSFSFQLSDSLKNITNEKLIRLAVADAKRKAGVIASEASLKLKNIRHIEYGATNFEAPVYPALKSRALLMEEDSGSMQGFSPNDMVVSDEVSILWELE